MSNTQKHYLKRYKKDNPSWDCSFNVKTSAIDKCCINQINDGADLVNEKLVYSDSSLLQCIISEENHISVYSEALFKTYPTRLLTKALAKFVIDNLQLGRKCVFSTKLQPIKTIDIYNDIYVYDGNRIYAYEESDDLSNAILLKSNSLNVEEDIAGLVTYTIRFLNDQKQKTLSSDEIKKLIEIGDNFGYDYMTYSSNGNDSTTDLYIQFESKLQDNTDIDIKDDLYHISPLNLKDKILKYGLKPKAASSINGRQLRHSDRVYVFNGLDNAAIMSFLNKANKMSKSYDKSLDLLKLSKSYALFKIDKKKLTNLKLYRDNMFLSDDLKYPLALYTYNNILPNAIEFILEIKLK